MEITEIKSRLPLSELIRHYNFKADKQNRICCPFHEDKTPSMQLYPKTNSAYCFSSNCTTHGKSLDVIEIVQRMEQTDKHGALLKCVELITGISGNTTAINKAPFLEKMFGYFRNAVPGSKPAQAYLKSRNLDAIKLEIGYNSGQFHHGARREEALIQQCLAVGLLLDKGLISRTGEKAYLCFGKNGIVFALKNAKGEIVSLYFRSTVNDTDQRHFYLKDRKGLYPGYPKPNTKKLILTESIIDAASLIQLQASDQYSILALYGTNGLTEEHLKAIKDLQELDEIIFCLNADEAGRSATDKHSKILKELKQTAITEIKLPEGEDVNSLLQGHEKEVFTELLNQRAFIFQLKKEHEPQAPTQLQNNNQLDTTNPEQIHYNTTEILITLLGGISLQNLDRLRVTVYIRRNPHLSASYSIRQNIDLYQDEAVEKLIRRSAEKLECSTSHISRALAELTEELEGYRLNQIEQKKIKTIAKKEMTVQEKNEALDNLKRADLMDWTGQSLLNTGIIGEAENAMILNFAMTSRLHPDPVSVICLSPSGAGKSYLLERVAKCFPPEDIIENTQFSDNSFYYFKNGLTGKIIIIEDMEGAANVEYPMRELISKKYITKTVVNKDNKGNMQTIQYRVDGPATFIGCTTKEKIYEDNANRCILIYIDSSREQDGKVMDYHKRNRAGITDTQGEARTREQLQNMQRMLKAKTIINPYAMLIALPEEVFKPRRTLGLLLNFIEAITLYHQHQCEIQGSALVVHPSHIEWGFRLLKESLFRKSDELNAGVRNFLESLKTLLTKEKKKSFYMQDTRLLLNKDPRTMRRYLSELNLYGYVKIAGGNKYRKGYEYELTELASNNNLQSSIDTHIERVMQHVWASYKERNKESQEGQ